MRPTSTCEWRPYVQLIQRQQLLQLSLLPTILLLLLLLQVIHQPQVLLSASQIQQDSNNRQPVTSSSSAQQRQQANSSQHELFNIQEADEQGLYLLGLFDLHQASPRAPFKCGPIELDAGELRSRRPMQNMEAFLWAIEQVNADKSLLPGVKLGSLVLDTCSSFLRTNQQLANLLHENRVSGDQMLAGAHLPRQLAAVVADQADWQSVEATASMASAQGLTTFVTQSRSARLLELARRYRAPVAAQLVEQLSQLNSAPVGFNLDLSQELLVKRSSGGPASPARNLEGLLGELLGVGKLPASGLITGDAQSATSTGNESFIAVPAVEERERLLMVRMQLGVEMVAEAIAALLQRMSWDFVSIVYDEEPDMIELHEELAKQMLARNMQLALDEQVSTSASSDTYDNLLLRLSTKTSLGARVVVSLVSSGTARNLLASLRRLRQQVNSSNAQVDENNHQEQVRQLNALLWISVSDREPYYAYAVDALGTLVISGASSLMADFRSHYERLSGSARNKWWPEYLKGILTRQQRELELLSNECTRWQEPSRSVIPERCAALSLSSLVQAERSQVVAKSNKQVVATSPTQPGRINKYLAGGWEHNGMEVINAVLAAANGLESVRQALCPESASGLCVRMRELMSREQVSTAAGLPTLSELMYNELLRSTFQLADGRMFNLDDFAIPGGQVEGKLKLYSLRYLQPNSIGFVRFGSYDQQDGLALNASKALHYPLGANPLQQEPIERVRSSCQDESRCLTAEAMGLSGASSSGQSASMLAKTAISEEELAMGVNSLFKLDHPLILSKSQSTAARETGAASEQRQQQVAEAEEDAQESHTMRSQLGHQFATAMTANLSQQQQQQQSNRTSQLLFNVIVLLPLHLAPDANANGNQQVQENRCADGPMDTERAFQQLAALAFAQTIANQQSGGEEQQIELTTTVIDYCERQELAKSRLARKVSSAPLVVASHSSTTGKSVAVIDFDAEVSKNVASLSNQADLLHLTIGAAASAADGDGERPLKTTAAAAAAGMAAGKTNHHRQQHLQISLLPGKSDELQALVKLIQSMANWRLVHLIYTDKQHRLRDEFVRRANEANICVSKLIWIPEAIEQRRRRLEEEGVAESNEQQQVAAAKRQLDKTRHLFMSELHDFGNSNQTENNYHAYQQRSSDGLNATRILVVLASEHAPTNRLLLEAATNSMLNDNVWLTTHEWLNSIERPAEVAEHSRVANNNINVQSLAGTTRLPRLFMSTRLESADAHEFGQFLEELTPATHSPIPTKWFDQFWQQHFHCRLPIAGSARPRLPLDPATPTCNPNQRLEARQLWQDERVHYTIRAIEALHVALSAHNNSQVTGGELANSFKAAYDRARQLEAPIGTGSGATSPLLARLPYGFHIVHRVLPFTDHSFTTVPTTSTRRDNSRNLMAATTTSDNILPPGELMRVGVWRSGELILARQQQRPTWIGAGELSDAETATAIAKSLARLAAIKSRCSSESTCSSACRAQITQTNALIKQEEARLRQIQAAEPSVVSSINRHNAQSSLDSQPAATFDEDTESPTTATTTTTTQRSRGSSQQDNTLTSDGDIQAAASSLINQRSVEQQRLDDIRAAYSRLRQAGWASAASNQPPFTLNLRQTSGALMSGLSLIGVVGIVLSMTYLYPSAASKNLEMSGTIDSSLRTNSWFSHSNNNNLRQLDNINDYFLLTGLLMLYSINMAFLLPATTGVCWFRRIGLPASYSVILSAVLVRVLAGCRNGRRRAISTTATSSRCSGEQQLPQSQQQQQVAVEPQEESVEVTFESLPAEPTNELPPADQSRGLSNGYQNNSSTNQHQQQSSESSCDSSDTYSGLVKTSHLLALQVALVLSQLLASLIRLARQPPEPTLYLGCWRCASPSRSPLLFFYEPLLSLLYPALMLITAWCLSIRNYRSAAKIEQQFRSATRLLLSPSVCQNDLQLTGKRQELKKRLRDAKSLVVTSTLLVFVWSLTTLHMISLSSNKLSPQQQQVFAQTGNQQQAAVYSTVMMSHSESTAKSDDLSLVYANIISGAIVFVFLFVYRLRLINRAALYPAHLFGLFKSQRTSGNAATATAAAIGGCRQSGSATQRVLKFNQQSMETTAATKWLDECNYPAVYGSSSSFTGSQFSARLQENEQHQERLKLQQFNTYGTYTATAQSSSNSSNHPLSFQAIASTFTSRKTPPTGTGSLKRDSSAGNGSQETLQGSGKRLSNGKKRNKASPASLFFGGGSSPNAATSSGIKRPINGGGNAQLQRRQSAGSVASSTAKLVRDNNWMLDEQDVDLEDTISCASSVASSSTSQLHGNDLYPINCSIQLDMQLANSSGNSGPPAAPAPEDGATTLNRSSGSFRRTSLRRSVASKLSSVREEQRTT